MVCYGQLITDAIVTELRNPGVLKIDLDRATYERCGLAGKAVAGFGKKHSNSRFGISFSLFELSYTKPLVEVELNLRLPSMLHGKKGFERIVWAFKNVLNQSLTWLFIDLNQPKGTNSDGMFLGT